MMSTQRVCIRAMTRADIDAAIEVERGSDTAPHWSSAEYLRCVEDSPGSPLRRVALAAEVKSSFAGFAVMRLLAADAGGEAELESIVVHPEFRRGGVGLQLIAALLAVARQAGALRIDLEVRASNASAIRLYRRAGLEECGRRSGYYDLPIEDAVLMSGKL